MVSKITVKLVKNYTSVKYSLKETGVIKSLFLKAL